MMLGCCCCASDGRVPGSDPDAVPLTLVGADGGLEGRDVVIIFPGYGNRGTWAKDALEADSVEAVYFSGGATAVEADYLRITAEHAGPLAAAGSLTIVGYSLGGAVATEFVFNHLATVSNIKALILLDPKSPAYLEQHYADAEKIAAWTAAVRAASPSITVFGSTGEGEQWAVQAAKLYRATLVQVEGCSHAELPRMAEWWPPQ